ncbi:MAG: deoxyribose-phosphate aldolase [Leucobacter sp.]
MTVTQSQFLANADHTLLAPGTTAAELRDFLDDARRIGVARVCISPFLVGAAVAALGTVDGGAEDGAADGGAADGSAAEDDAGAGTGAGSAAAGALGGLEIVTVVGFPSGAHRPEIKAAEAAQAVADGAHEIDMVVNRGLVRAAAAGDGGWAAVEAEIRAVREACPGRVLKAILETAALNDDEIVGACRAAEAAGADFVKTSTGFDPAGGASLHAVRLMADTVGGRLGVKASGGIRTADAVREMHAAGATRFGVSGTAAILSSWDEPGDPAPAADAAPDGY